VDDGKDAKSVIGHLIAGLQDYDAAAGPPRPSAPIQRWPEQQAAHPQPGRAWSGRSAAGATTSPAGQGPPPRPGALGARQGGETGWTRDGKQALVRLSCPPRMPAAEGRPRLAPVPSVPNPCHRLPRRRGLLTLALTIVGSGACSSSADQALQRRPPADPRHTWTNWCAVAAGDSRSPAATGGPGLLLQALAPKADPPAAPPCGWSGLGAATPLAALGAQTATLRRHGPGARTAKAELLWRQLAAAVPFGSGRRLRSMRSVAKNPGRRALLQQRFPGPSRRLSRRRGAAPGPDGALLEGSPSLARWGARWPGGGRQIARHCRSPGCQPQRTARSQLAEPWRSWAMRAGALACSDNQPGG